MLLAVLLALALGVAEAQNTVAITTATCSLFRGISTLDAVAFEFESTISVLSAPTFTATLTCAPPDYRFVNAGGTAALTLTQTTIGLPILGEGVAGVYIDADRPLFNVSSNTCEIFLVARVVGLLIAQTSVEVVCEELTEPTLFELQSVACSSELVSGRAAPAGAFAGELHEVGMLEGQRIDAALVIVTCDPLLVDAVGGGNLDSMILFDADAFGPVSDGWVFYTVSTSFGVVFPFNFTVRAKRLAVGTPVPCTARVFLFDIGSLNLPPPIGNSQQYSAAAPAVCEVGSQAPADATMMQNEQCGTLLLGRTTQALRVELCRNETLTGGLDVTMTVEANCTDPRYTVARPREQRSFLADAPEPCLEYVFGVQLTGRVAQLGTGSLCTFRSFDRNGIEMFDVTASVFCDDEQAPEIVLPPPPTPPPTTDPDATTVPPTTLFPPVQMGGGQQLEIWEAALIGLGLALFITGLIIMCVVLARKKGEDDARLLETGAQESDAQEAAETKADTEALIGASETKGASATPLRFVPIVRHWPSVAAKQHRG